MPGAALARGSIRWLAQPDATLFQNLMADEHCLHGFSNRDARARLMSMQLLRACANDPKKASAEVGGCFCRLHAHGLISKIPAAGAGASPTTAAKSWVRRSTCGSSTSRTSTPASRIDLLLESQTSHNKRIYPPNYPLAWAAAIGAFNPPSTRRQRRSLAAPQGDNRRNVDFLYSRSRRVSRSRPGGAENAKNDAAFRPACVSKRWQCRTL